MRERDRKKRKIESERDNERGTCGCATRCLTLQNTVQVKAGRAVPPGEWTGKDGDQSDEEWGQVKGMAPILTQINNITTIIVYNV